MELLEVASDVFAVLQEDLGWGWNNAGFVATGAGMMVDTFIDVKHTREALALYAEKGPRPHQLVNTHHNIDHCWGNQLFGDAEIIAHRQCAERMAKDFTPDSLIAILEQPDPSPGVAWFAADLKEFDFAEVEKTLPNRLLDGDTQIEVGGTAAEILYLGPAHTAGDVVVYLPEKGVVFAGDLIFRQCTPIGWEGTTAGWVSALERIAALAPETIVPGHGPLCGVEGALEMRDYLQYVYDESKRFYEQELPAEEAAKRIDLGPYADWTQPERVVFNVDRVYRELRGGAWDEAVEIMRLLDSARALGLEREAARS